MIEALIVALVKLIVLACIVGLIAWLVRRAPLDEPPKGWIVLAVYAIGVLIAILILLPLLGVRL